LKAIFERLTNQPDEGFSFKTLRGPSFDCPWHVHPEYELILVVRGRGCRIVGDNVSRLGAGDMVLVGPGLPHIWQDEPAARKPAVIEARLIQFDEKFLADGLLRLPAMLPLRRLLGRAQRGLHIVGKTRARVSVLMNKMTEFTGMERIVQFLQILTTLAASEECEPIASAGFAIKTSVLDQQRMERVFELLMGETDESVRLSDAARVINLSEGAFSRFFRKHTGKTFPGFRNELRVGRACALLMERDLNITEVALRCGFMNLSNFNRQFRKLKRMNPHEFRRRFRP
jgi:AraC-like DNA-binding protein